MTKVFIDGSAGTTGLRIFDRLKDRKDLVLTVLPEAIRKDVSARKDALNAADVAFLCLPDDAAREAVSLIEGNVVAIDTSTAHRVSEGWTYGFPEIVGKEAIQKSKRIANPGCHASGFVSLLYPLVRAGIVKRESLLSFFSLTGYTGGGKKMIAEYEGDKPLLYNAPRQYGLPQTHKHIPEMQKVCGLFHAPCFCPVVADFPCGMEVTVPLFGEEIFGKKADVIQVYKDFYKGNVVFYSEESENGFLSSASFAGKDSMAVSVFGNDERMILVSRFDNLGKGASGAAIQNMNIALGAEETTGLVL